MQSEGSLHREQESEAFGRFLLETMAQIYNCEANEQIIDRRVYKTTDCGAWLRFDEYGILVGTIVEGSDAEYSERVSLEGIKPTKKGAGQLRKRVFAALQRCEDFSDEVWAEMELTAEP